MNTKIKWAHLIGMCGVTMAPVAKMLQDKGFYVTGSDKGIYPPISDYIQENNLNLVLGFKAEHLTRKFYEDNSKYKIPETNDNPDFIVVGNFTGPSNPEYKFAEENNIVKYSFPEILAKYIIKEESIVTVGTYGKTTSSGLLVHIFEQAGKNPSYMIGGISGNFKHGVRSNESRWSIVEGDEYISSRWDNKSKFYHYSPKYLLLSSVAWDHSDIYKTEQDYIDNFKKLVMQIPKDGKIVACIDGLNVNEVIGTVPHLDITTYSTRFYGNNNVSDYYADNQKYNGKSGYFEFEIFDNQGELVIKLESKLIGLFNYENMTGATILALRLGIEKKDIINALKSFAGIRRRLEMIYDNSIKVIDDFAASPPKISGSVRALKEAFPNSKIIVIYEPNTGSRSYQILGEYDGIFNGCSEVIIPRLRDTKMAKGERRYTGSELVDRIKTTFDDVSYIPNDSKLIEYLSEQDDPKSVVVFMGSGSFRGMREQIVRRLRKEST